eukprot:ANDGO_00773.mRNA.1 hypothetical protein CAOG_03730
MANPPAPPARRTRRHRGANKDSGEERRALNAKVEAQFTAKTRTLEGCNKLLGDFGLPPCESITKARAELAKIHINIYDLVAGRFDKVHKSVPALRKYSVDNGLIFPKQQAKSQGLRDFLRCFTRRP